MGEYSNMCCKIYYISMKIHQQSIISSPLRERASLLYVLVIYTQKVSKIKVDFEFKFIEIYRAPQLLGKCYSLV